MAKSVASGLHKLKSVFGECVFDLSQELQSLRAQLQVVDREYAAAGVKQLRDRTIAGNVFIISLLMSGLWLVWLMEREVDYGPNRALSKTVGAALVVLLIVSAGAGVTYARLLNRPTKKRAERGRRADGLRSQIEHGVEQYAARVNERLMNPTSKRGEVGRTAWLGATAWLFYCPSYTALVDFIAEEMILLNTIDCRDVRLSYKEIARRSVSVGSIHSAFDRSLAGAAIGTLIFGEAGMVAGSVIGSAGERKVSMETTERKIGKHVIDLYTRVQELPVVTLQFDNDRLAKEFYGVMSAAVARPR